jgi:hypothetical protein
MALLNTRYNRTKMMVLSAYVHVTHMNSARMHLPYYGWDRGSRPISFKNHNHFDSLKDG